MVVIQDLNTGLKKRKCQYVFFFNLFFRQTLYKVVSETINFPYFIFFFLQVPLPLPAAASTTPKVNQKPYVTCAVISNRKTIRAFLLSVLSGIGLDEIDRMLLKLATGILSQQLSSVSSEPFHQGTISLECEVPKVVLIEAVQL